MGRGPQHIAIIMDGNGRWANQRFLPRIAGHKAGVEATRRIVEAAVKQGIKVLTLFAFSSENWSRPEEEVSLLADLFIRSLDQEIERLHANGISVRFIGDITAFGQKLQSSIEHAQELTCDNQAMTLVIAANYGGQWDIVQAARSVACDVMDGALLPETITAETFSGYLSMSDLPPPDLLIRSSGEQRISNFLLWQLAYSELYFTKTLWPDFDEQALMGALAFYESRQRRFGKTAEQIQESGHA